MSILANAILNLAKSIAESRGSGLAINIQKDGSVKYEYISKSSDGERIWEDHYNKVAFYLGDMANPVRFDLSKVEESDDETVIDAIDNAIATKYYKTFMNNEALSRIFNISGPQQDLIIKLLYANIAGIAIVGLLLLAIYGGA